MKFTRHPQSPVRSWRPILGIAVGLRCRHGARDHERPHATAGVRTVPHRGIRLRPRPQHRQRGPGRHPSMGHDGRGLRARRRGHWDRGVIFVQTRNARLSRATARTSHRPSRPGARGCTAVERCAPSADRSSSRSSPGSSSTSCSRRRSTCSSPATTSRAAASPVDSSRLALVIRYLAGGRYELDEAAPSTPGSSSGWACSSSSPRRWPRSLSGARSSRRPPWTSSCRSGARCTWSPPFFDAGVYLIVVGMMLDIVRSLGTGIDRHIAEASDERRGGRRRLPRRRRDPARRRGSCGRTPRRRGVLRGPARSSGRRPGQHRGREAAP